MSTASMPVLQENLRSSASRIHHARFQKAPASPAVSRRPDRESGRALECLGHAIEYLIDSGHDQSEEGADDARLGSLAILKSASRDVFAKCPEVVPFRRRMLTWFKAAESAAPNRARIKS